MSFLHRRLGFFTIFGIVAIVTSVVVFSHNFSVSAAVFNYVVNTTNWTADATPGDGICSDGANCSLRAAIQEANADGGTTAITFHASLNGGTITYNANVPEITAPVTITGPGAANLTLNCGTAPVLNAIDFADGGEGTSITGGFTTAGCTGGRGIVDVRSNTTISDFTINGTGAIEVSVSGNVTGVTISDNTLTAGASIVLSPSGYTTSSSTISGNSIDAASGDAISGIIGTSTVIDTNTITNSGNSGIDVDIAGDDVSITNNTVDDSGDTAIYVDVTGALVDNLDVSSNAIDGVTLNKGIWFNSNSNVVTAATMNANTITNNTNTDGIKISGLNAGSDLTVNGNTVTKSASFGIITQDIVTGSDLIITNNTVGGSDPNANGGGIVFVNTSGGDLTLTGNTVTYNNSSLAAVHFYAGSGGDGFDSATINSNTITNHDKEGIKIEHGSAITIGAVGVGNTISSNGGVGDYAGIALNGAAVANVTIAYNTINSNSYYGVRVQSASTGIAIADNTINSNTQNGIYIQSISTGSTISDNAIGSNTRSGIVLANSTGVALSGNTITSNGSAATPGEFTANYFLYTFGGNEYDNGDAPFGYVIDTDLTLVDIDFISEDETTVAIPDGTNNFNLAMILVDGVYLTVFVDAANIDSSGAANTACDALPDYGDCTIDVFLEDIFTANGAEENYTYDAAAVAAAGVTITTWSSSPAWTFVAGGYEYYGTEVTGSGVNTFSDETLTGNGNGYKFGNTAVSQTISDSSISTSVAYDIEIKAAGAITVSLDNTTFTDYLFNGGVDDVIDVNYDARVRTLNTSAVAIQGATGTAVNVSSASTVLSTTDASGYTPYNSLDAYQIDSTGVINTKNPYVFTTVASGYVDGTSAATTLDNPNETITLTLDPGSRSSGPSGGGGGSSTPPPATPATTTETTTTEITTIPGPLKVGDLVRLVDIPAVYQIDTDAKRHVFLDAPTYFSWYPDFSAVQVVSQETLLTYPVGTPMFYKPGTLLKIPSVPKVYLLETPNVLRWITSETVFHALGYNFSQVKDLAESLFSLYVEGSPIN